MKLRNIRIKDVFSPVKWGVYAVHIYKKYVRRWGKKLEARFLLLCGETTLDGKDLKMILTGKVNPDAISEVEKSFNVVFRYLSCEDCMTAGSCPHCGCTTPDNIFPEKNFCSGHKWAKMMKDIQFLKLRIYQLLKQKQQV